MRQYKENDKVRVTGLPKGQYWVGASDNIPLKNGDTLELGPKPIENETLSTYLLLENSIVQKYNYQGRILRFKHYIGEKNQVCPWIPEDWVEPIVEKKFKTGDKVLVVRKPEGRHPVQDGWGGDSIKNGEEYVIQDPPYAVDMQMSKAMKGESYENCILADELVRIKTKLSDSGAIWVPQEWLDIVEYKFKGGERVKVVNKPEKAYIEEGWGRDIKVANGEEYVISNTPYANSSSPLYFKGITHWRGILINDLLRMHVNDSIIWVPQQWLEIITSPKVMACVCNKTTLLNEGCQCPAKVGVDSKQQIC